MLDLKRHLENANVDLDFTRAMRKKLIEAKIAHAGEDLGKMHSETLSAVAGLLSDMDRTALSLAKIKTDETAANAQAAAANLIAAVLEQRGVKQMGMVDVVNPEGAVALAPVLDMGIMEVTVTPEEMAIGTASIDYDSFMERQRSKNAGA